jgi:glycine hydroxymethyltransferase
MNLAHGGHLTHGHSANFSGKFYEVTHYGVSQNDERIDYDALAKQAREVKPKMITAGASAYPRTIDFARMGEIAKSVGAYLFVDMAHIAGLVAGGVHPSPMEHADFITSTTHKSLRGPRGGIVLTNDEQIAKKINSAIFPGIQGGPLMHVIAGKAVAFHEALQPAFKAYQQRVVDNARVLAETLTERGLRIVSGRTESHVMLVDLRPKGLTGKEAETLLGDAHMTCNKNGIPNDPQKPMVTSGIRLGTPALTTRGFGVDETRRTAHLIADVLDHPHDEAALSAVRTRVAALTRDFPVYR